VKEAMAAASASPAPTRAAGADAPVLGEPMKILFLGWRYTYFRNFESVLQELAGRGHQVHLAVGRRGAPAHRAARVGLSEHHLQCRCSRADDDWSWAATRLRFGVDTCAISTGCSTTRRKTGPVPRTHARAVRLARRRHSPLGAVGAASDVGGRAVAQRSVPDDPAIRAYPKRTGPTWC
jgi:hypothetical protein